MFRRNKNATKPASRSKSMSAVSTTDSGPRNNAASSAASRARSMSVPTYRPHFIKGILKYHTEDESIHSTYGESKDSSERRRSITFKDIMIREYARTVGDNPSCSSGPPISISWEYDPDATILPVEQYEQLRPPRRSHFEMVLPREIRQRILRNEWKVTQAQIAAAVRANIKIKNQRRATFNNLDKATKMEEMMESAAKKFSRGLSFQKSTDKELAELEKQMKAVHLQRQQHQLERMQVSKEDLGATDDDDDEKEEQDETSNYYHKEQARATNAAAQNHLTSPPSMDFEPFEVEA